MFWDNSIVARCFWSFILLILEYCSSVWMSVPVSYLSLFDRVVRSVFSLSGDAIRCDLWDRCRDFVLPLFYHRGSAGHSVGHLFPQLFAAGRPTRHNLAMHSYTLVCPRCRTFQYSRSFVPACVSLWNVHDVLDFGGDGLGAFKTNGIRTLGVHIYFPFHLLNFHYFILYVTLLSFSSLFYHSYLSSILSFFFWSFVGLRWLGGLSTWRLRSILILSLPIVTRGCLSRLYTVLVQGLSVWFVLAEFTPP